MRFNRLLLACAASAAILASSCSSSKEICYFQDLKPGTESVLPAVKPIRLQENDQVSITVSTTDSRLNSLYNLQTSEGSGTSERDVRYYTLDSNGDINFPVLGKLHVAGMNREELAEYIRRELISRDLAKNPIVTVNYRNLSVTVLGEVASPGLYDINREDFSILDAIGEAGDLTIYGKRDNIKVLREENGMQRVYIVDLTNGKDLTKSPVYYLQQNDVIYIEPNDTKARQSTPNGNSALTPTFWISIASFALTIALLIVK